MNKTLLFFAVITACYMISCNQASTQQDTKEQKEILDKTWAKSFIDSMNNQFSQQIASGDTAALASHYWPDAELLLDNSEVVKGPDILSTWGAVIRMGLKEMTFSSTDITGSPDLIIETGNYEMKDAGQSIIDKGKYVVIWEKRNGEWKLYRDIGCTSLPASK